MYFEVFQRGRSETRLCGVAWYRVAAAASCCRGCVWLIVANGRHAGGMWAKEREGSNMKGGKRCSQTGTRTRVCWVRASYPNHLDYLGSRTIHTHNTNNTSIMHTHHQTNNYTATHTTTCNTLARAQRIANAHSSSTIFFRHTRYTDHNTLDAWPQSHGPLSLPLHASYTLTKPK